MHHIPPDRVKEQADFFRKEGRNWPEFRHCLICPQYRKINDDEIYFYKPIWEITNTPREIRKFARNPNDIAAEVIQLLGLPQDCLHVTRESQIKDYECIHIFYGMYKKSDDCSSLEWGLAGFEVLRVLSYQAFSVLSDAVKFDPKDPALDWMEFIDGDHGSYTINKSVKDVIIFNIKYNIFDESAAFFEMISEDFGKRIPEGKMRIVVRNAWCYDLYATGLKLGEVAAEINAMDHWEPMNTKAVWAAIKKHASSLKLPFPKRKERGSKR